MTAQSPYAQPPGGGPVASSSERTWGWVSHAGCFVGAWIAMAFLVPLVIMLTKGKESPFVRRHAVESLNFQINAAVYTVVFALLIFVVIGLILLPLYGLFYVIFVIRGSVVASRGEDFRYPLTVRLVR